MDSSIPSHALHMRRAVEDIRRGMEELSKKIGDGADVSASAGILTGNGRSQYDQQNYVQQLLQSAWLASQRYQEERDDGLQDVQKRLYSCYNPDTTAPGPSLPIDTVYVQEDGSSWDVIGPRKERSDNCDDNKGMRERETPEWNDAYQFKQQYISRNVPCVIRGLDNSHFAEISNQWRSKVHHSDDTTSGGNNQSRSQENIKKVNENELESRSSLNGTKINTEWFRRFVGNDTLVPVRIDNFGTRGVFNNEDDQKGELNGLDEEGRAQECETKQMKLTEWIIRCQKQSLNVDDPTNNMQSGYLKDWHLVQYLSKKQNAHSIEPSPFLPLYTTPIFFDRDLLNNFLHRYSDGGDYKFTYWGPAGSQTRLHSDVLHSFSWSYNVVGKKKWIFHVPTCHEEGDNQIISEKRYFEVIQHTGEAIFVPSTWKHEVINLEETLSINHNWITSACIDQTWHCLLLEIAAVEKELSSWDVIPKDDFEARENMLRGCIGLDFTMFTLMVVLEIVELLHILFDCANKDNIAHQDGRYGIEDCAFSIFRLEIVLMDVMRQPNMVLRLEVMLDSQLYALEFNELANEAIKHISLLKQVPIPTTC